MVNSLAGAGGGGVVLYVKYNWTYYSAHSSLERHYMDVFA